MCTAIDFLMLCAALTSVIAWAPGDSGSACCGVIKCVGLPSTTISHGGFDEIISVPVTSADGGGAAVSAALFATCAGCGFATGCDFGAACATGCDFGVATCCVTGGAFGAGCATGFGAGVATFGCWTGSTAATRLAFAGSGSRSTVTSCCVRGSKC